MVLFLGIMRLSIVCLNIVTSFTYLSCRVLYRFALHVQFYVNKLLSGAALLLFGSAFLYIDIINVQLMS